MRPDVAVIIATTGERRALLEYELASIDEAILAAFGYGVSADVIIEPDPERSGVGPTLARGLARADARFTTFWGDDDVMGRDYLWRHVQLADREGLDVVSCSMDIVGPSLEPIGVRILPLATMGDFIAGRVTVNDGALVRSAARLPLRPERGRAMMLTFWMDMLAAGRRFGTIRDRLWSYRRHPGQLSATWSDAERAMRDAIVAEYIA